MRFIDLPGYSNYVFTMYGNIYTKSPVSEVHPVYNSSNNMLEFHLINDGFEKDIIDAASLFLELYVGNLPFDITFKDGKCDNIGHLHII